MIIRFFIIFFAAYIGIANAEVINRQRDSSSKSEASTNISDQQSLTPGSLFFPLLADVEKAMNQGVDLDVYVQEKAALGYLKMPPKPWRWSYLAEGCHVLLADQFVWGNDPNGFHERKNAMLVITEMPMVKQSSEQILFSSYTAKTFGQPVAPMHYIFCVQYHATAIQKAINRLKKYAVEKRGVLYIDNLKARAAESLYTTLINGDIPFFDKFVGDCMVPSSTVMPSQNTFRCPPWTITQSPLQAVHGGQIVLSDDTIFGVKYLFQEASSLNKSRSSSTTDSRKGRIEQ